MKKFYLLLIALMVGMAVNAADTFYLRGDMNGWGAKAEWQFKQVSGNDYKLENVTIAAGNNFKVADASYGAINYGGKTNMELGKEYTLTHNGSNCSLNVAFTGTVYFNTSSHIIKFEGQGQEIEYNNFTVYYKNTKDWAKVNAYLWDGGYSNTWPGEAMTKGADGLWSITVKSVNPPANVVFNDGSSQTADFVFEDGATYDYSGKIEGDNPNPDPDPEPGTFEKFYIIGNGDWGKSGAEFTTTDGKTYTATVEISAAFKIWNGAWKSDGGIEYGGAGDDSNFANGQVNLQSGVSTNAWSGSSVNFAAAAGTYDLTFVYNSDQSKASTLTAVKKGENPNPNPDPDPEPGTFEKFYIIGNGDWGKSGAEFTTTDGVNYTATVEITDIFKIWNGAWKSNGGIEYGGAGDDSNFANGQVTLQNGVQAAAWSGSSVNFATPEKAEYTLTFVYNSDQSKASSLTAVKKGNNPNPDPDPEPGEFQKLYIIGNGDWENSGAELATTDGKTYTAKAILTDNFKIWGGSWDLNFGGSSSDPGYKKEGEDEIVTLTPGQSSEAWKDSSVNFAAPEEGEYVLTFVLSAEGASSLTIAKTVEPGQFQKFYIIGNGDWDNSGTELTTDDGVNYSATVDFTGEAFKIWNGAWDSDGGISFGGSAEDPGYTEEGTEKFVNLTLEQETNAWKDSSVNFVAPQGQYKVEFVYSSNHNVASKLTLSRGNSVESIEAAASVAPVYYNLQGVKVAQPAQGLYIVVRGDKVTKELVK